LSGTTRVQVLRDESYTGFLSSIVIQIDGKKAAKVRRGRRVEFEVTAGEHIITARMHLLRSEIIGLTAEEGTKLRFVCGCRGYGGTIRVWLRAVGYEYHRG
jgi:hypothetical protein